jgi:hypothetical protein
MEGLVNEPTRDEVDAAIRSVALDALDDMPVGSTVMISQAIAYKSMPWHWELRVYGPWHMLPIWIKRWRKRRPR